VIDVTFRRFFQSNGISFPSSLGACGALFAILLLLPQSFSDRLFIMLQPGALILAKWLPVFFVPSLVTLPLADSVGNALELLKIGSVVLLGFFFTLLSTAYSVKWVRSLTALSTTSSAPSQDRSTVMTQLPPFPRAFSDELFHFLCLCTASTGVAALFSKGGSMAASLFWLFATLNGFVLGVRLPNAFKQIVHPLVTCTALAWAAIAAISVSARGNFLSMLKLYKTGRLRGTASGAGDMLLFLLGPAVISLAISMYEKRKLMRQNLTELGTAITVSTAGGLYGTALAVRLLGIASPYLRLSLLSRNITSPLAMAIAGILGADISLAVSMVVVTGLIGANFGAATLDAFGVEDPVARGLGIGAAAHGLGTAAFTNEKDAFPFAAISMALTASAATVAVSIPLCRKSLIQLALGA
jgi:putative effector of murein hydrolase